MTGSGGGEPGGRSVGLPRSLERSVEDVGAVAARGAGEEAGVARMGSVQKTGPRVAQAKRSSEAQPAHRRRRRKTVLQARTCAAIQ
jgi:hypothetical protein